MWGKILRLFNLRKERKNINNARANIGEVRVYVCKFWKVERKGSYYGFIQTPEQKGTIRQRQQRNGVREGEKSLF